ncbi:MAG: exopolysaccharide biosynthesis protein [Pseudobdellovibrionaceae bacterium]
MPKKQQELEIADSPLLKAIELIEKETEHRGLTLGELMELLGEMGHGILILLLCLFFLQPLPLPGISTPIGLIIIISATLQFLNLPPWIPRRFRDLMISQSVLHKVAVVARKIWVWLEKFLSPRLVLFTKAPPFRFVNLLLIVLSAFLLALPLPIPFTNTVPSIVILLIVSAQLEEDGLLILFAYLMTVVMIFFFYSLGAGIWNFAQRPWTSLL